MGDTQARHGRILIVEDEESLRHALKRGLGRAGYDAVVAATGREGIDRFAEGDLEAVLTDVRLPDLTGLELVAIFAEMDADVPVVVMTGYGSVDTALEAMRRGARDYIEKPFEVGQVVRILERTIAERRLTSENRRLRAFVERRFRPDAYERVDAELEARGTDAPGASGAAEAAPSAGDRPDADPLPLKEAQRQFEIRYVERLLARTGGNIAAASRLAGISRPNFHKKLKTLGVDASRFKEAARRGRTRDL